MPADRELSRFYVKVDYHLWSLRDRETENVLAWFGARQYGGDKPARLAANAALMAARANERKDH